MSGGRTTIIAAAMALAGCDAILGIKDLPRGVATIDAGSDTGPPPNATCLACEGQRLSEERTACLGDPDCAALYTCSSRCLLGDVACRDRCEQLAITTAQGAAYRKLDARRRELCAGDCYGSFGFASAINPLCGCLDAHCARQMLACVQSGVAKKEDVGACERRLACIARQPNPDGFVDCVGQFGGAEEANALIDCMRDTSCTDKATKKACPLADGELSCTNNFVYARSRGTHVRFTLSVEDFEGKPIVGAVVKACSPPRCAADCLVLASDKTESNGRVTLKVPMSNGGYDGCLRVEPSSEYMPTSVMTGRRIHVDEAVLGTLSLQEGLIALYAVEAMVALRADRGHVIVSVHDCVWGQLLGASLTLTDMQPDTVLAYLDGTTIVPDGKKTTASGAAAFVNVTPGKHELVVTHDGREIARQTVSVSAGELTDANVYPLPK